MLRKLPKHILIDFNLLSWSMIKLDGLAVICVMAWSEYSSIAVWKPPDSIRSLKDSDTLSSCSDRFPFLYPLCDIGININIGKYIWEGFSFHTYQYEHIFESLSIALFAFIFNTVKIKDAKFSIHLPHVFLLEPFQRSFPLHLVSGLKSPIPESTFLGAQGFRKRYRLSNCPVNPKLTQGLSHALTVGPVGLEKENWLKKRF